MNVIVEINNALVVANKGLDFVVFWGGVLALLAYPVYFFASNLNKYAKENKHSELLSQTITLFVFLSVGIVIWALPDIIWLGITLYKKFIEQETTRWQDLARIFSTVRLILFLGVFFCLSYFMGHEHGKKRWLYSSLGHIIAILIGWLVDSWMGIILISIPLIAAYYTMLYSLATVVLPASNPEDKAERFQRFHILASYTWGTQSPITVVDGHAWKKYDPRIPGDITWEFSEFPIPLLDKLKRPGLIWTRSHHAAAITGGTKFKRVEGPGVAFTGKLERLDQVFDLRLQLRTREIDVVSKDGIRFSARYFTGFRIDNEEWNRSTYNKVRPLNPYLRGAGRLNCTVGSFPFSTLRIQATLGITSTKANTGDALVYWDQWAVNVIEDQTRKVISQKNLDDMWRPAEDSKFANALDVIAKEIKDNSETLLRSKGILLVLARVVNFRFPVPNEQSDDIAKQQINTWASEWDRKRHRILDEAEAGAERAQQEARAYAESLLLNSIAEGLQKTHEINPQLPRHVIAMRFLSSLQDYVHNAAVEEEGNEGAKNRQREKSGRDFQEWEKLFLLSRGREK